jgi:hypothetical protein
MEDIDYVCNKSRIENLLSIRDHFFKVQQHVEHDSAKLMLLQRLGGTCASPSELPYEKAQGR